MGILNPWSLYLEAFFLMCFVFVVVENILGQSSVKDKHACHSVPHNYFRASDEAVTHLHVQMGNISSSVQHTPSRSRRRIREDQRTCLSIIFLGRSWRLSAAAMTSWLERGTRHGPRVYWSCTPPSSSPPLPMRTAGEQSHHVPWWPLPVSVTLRNQLFLN